MELERILAGSTAVFGPGPGILGPSAIFRCSGSKTPLLVFDESSNDLHIGKCGVHGSAVCVNTPALEAEVCREIRRLPAYGNALFGFDGSGGEDRAGAGKPYASTEPAQALALVPQDVYGLVAASGEIDLGGMAITLPSSQKFGFVHAFGFPLKFVFQGDADGEPLALYLERLGWPDRDAQPVSALAVPLERRPQVDFLMNWEQDYSQRDLREWGYGKDVELSAYRSTFLDIDGGP